MVKVLILVEGQTEEAFVKNLLAIHLRQHGVVMVPVIVATKRLLTGNKQRGGYVPYSRLRAEVQRLLRACFRIGRGAAAGLLPLGFVVAVVTARCGDAPTAPPRPKPKFLAAAPLPILKQALKDSSAVCVTTMLDYYGLAPEFPGREHPVGKTSLEKVSAVEQAWVDDIQHRKFIPYLALHEFEAMLFTDPRQIADSFGIPALHQSLQSVRMSFPTPEDINDCEETAPSKRLGKFFPGYNKPFYGELIAERIGIERIRNECSHFAGWLSQLEALGDPR